MGGWLSLFQRIPILVVIRDMNPEVALSQAQLAYRIGFPVLEITSTTPDYLNIVQTLQKDCPQGSVGVGTIRDPSMAKTALEAGAHFLVSPFTDLNIIALSQEAQIPVIPGALTPAEIWQAWQAGATAIKVFPIESVGGSDYLRHLRAPLGNLPLIPTGGITLERSHSFLANHALAVGLGRDLFPPIWMQSQRWDLIEERLQCFLDSLTAHFSKPGTPEPFTHD
jgi:2-dehydro-3-deoxyphosphogluconate aldolase/(4S)-4-hydroxy-2-oxoglutarate aldolase